MIAGNLIGIMVNGAFVSCETSCQINFGVNMLNSSAVDSGRWAEFVPGLRNWTISVNGNLLLEAVSSDIKALITSGYINGNPLYVVFSTRPQSDTQMSFAGAAYLSQASISAAAKGLANWSANFQGTGALTTSYTEYDLLIDAMPSLAAYPIILDTTGGFTT